MMNFRNRFSRNGFKALNRQLCTGGPPPSGPKRFLEVAFKYSMVIVVGLGLGYIGSELLVIQKKIADIPFVPASALGPDKAKEALDFLEEPQGEVTERVFFDISVDDGAPERIIFGLYGKECPKTVANFSLICSGEAKSKLTEFDIENKKEPRKLHYLSSTLHRIIPSFMIQGGDFVKGDGTGGESIYGPRFTDESFKYKHTGFGVLSMANRGKDTNSSQFFILLKDAPWLDGKHVVFGQVLNGVATLRKVEGYGCRAGTPSASIKVVACGVLPALEDTIAYNEPVGGKEDLDATGRRIDRIMK
jgi:peptidylprolyl isomerase